MSIVLSLDFKDFVTFIRINFRAGQLIMKVNIVQLQIRSQNKQSRFLFPLIVSVSSVVSVTLAFMSNPHASFLSLFFDMQSLCYSVNCLLFSYNAVVLADSTTGFLDFSI